MYKTKKSSPSYLALQIAATSCNAKRRTFLQWVECRVLQSASALLSLQSAAGLKRTIHNTLMLLNSNATKPKLHSH